MRKRKMGCGTSVKQPAHNPGKVAKPGGLEVVEDDAKKTEAPAPVLKSLPSKPVEGVLLDSTGPPPGGAPAAHGATFASTAARTAILTTRTQKAKAEEPDWEQNVKNSTKDQKGWHVFMANEKLAATRAAPWADTKLVCFQRGRTAEKVASLPADRKGIVSVSTCTTDVALRYLASKHPDTKLAALSYANNVFIGGKYFEHPRLVGAQEEDLCYKFPALFTSLQWVQHPIRPEQFFRASTLQVSENPGKEKPRLRMCYPTDLRFGSGVSALPGRSPFRQEKSTDEEKNVLFSGELDLMRSSTYSLLPEKERVRSGIVTAAAPVWRPQDWYTETKYKEWLSQKLGDGPDSWNKDWYKDALLNIFFAPKLLDQAYDVIVVGAWGLGAFLTDVPPDVAKVVKKNVSEAYVEVIKEHCLLDRYKEIHFAWGPTAFGILQEALTKEFDAKDYTAIIQATIIEEDRRR